MKLYGSFTSPYVRHCRIALEDSGEQYEFVEADYTRSGQESTAQRVPYMQIGTMRLNDSATILKFVREHSGGEFFPDLLDFDLFCLVNAALDTCVNLFLLEREGLPADANPYMQRQHGRILSILEHLNARTWPTELPWTDGTIRLMCFLDWAQFRNRVDLTPYPVLLGLLEQARQRNAFIATAPPQ
ncbi:MAG: glutathione S-transferase family protein [Idiomarina sp.]|nr:glutathione S-transferase family protein [Idiomarina sp.]